MKALAPGKLVLSGAYAVLSGAPALVTAVDRYVTADASRLAELITPEVQAALGPSARAPWFDASALREGDRKLGLGSSAAILVASLAAQTLAARGPISDGELAELVFQPALLAHARAQGGGSGVDVAAAAFGGTLVFHRDRDAGGEASPPSILRVGLPRGLVIETWWSGRPAATSDFVRRVKAFAERDPSGHAELIAAQSRGAEQAVRAVLAGRANDFSAALAAQFRALAALGAAAGAEIVTPAAERLSAAAAPAVVLPAGAGGGDIVLHVGEAPSSASFRALASELDHRLLPLSLGARGVHAFEA